MANVRRLERAVQSQITKLEEFKQQKQFMINQLQSEMRQLDQQIDILEDTLIEYQFPSEDN